MATEEPDGVAVPIVWVGADDLPVYHANQFVAQVSNGEVFLTVGEMVPPAIVGATVEERREQAEAIQYVPVKPVVRLAFSPTRLNELISILQITKENHEAQGKVFGDPRDNA
ncbi:MAG TPA: hypothetical protein VMT10_12480 [Solirubrobacteraceae bacterium]|nr:hypothetical protein [Solirubrobacteraceae bacterium]